MGTGYVCVLCLFDRGQDLSHMDIWRYGPECELCHQGGQAVTESTNFKTSHEIPKIKHNSRYVCELCLQDDGFNTNDVGDWQIGPTCSICGPLAEISLPGMSVMPRPSSLLMSVIWSWSLSMRKSYPRLLYWSTTSCGGRFPSLFLVCVCRLPRNQRRPALSEGDSRRTDMTGDDSKVAFV